MLFRSLCEPLPVTLGLSLHLSIAASQDGGGSERLESEKALDPTLPRLSQLKAVTLPRRHVPRVPPLAQTVHIPGQSTQPLQAWYPLWHILHLGLAHPPVLEAGPPRGAVLTQKRKLLA